MLVAAVAVGEGVLSQPRLASEFLANERSVSKPGKRYLRKTLASTCTYTHTTLKVIL